MVPHMRRFALPLVLLALSLPTLSIAGECDFYLAGRRQFLTRDFSREGNRVRVAFFDADDTLRTTLSGYVAPNHPDDVSIMPNTAEKLRELSKQGYLIAVVSNQFGISKNYVTYENADRALFRMVKLLKEQGATVHYYDFAEDKDHNHKPATGMARTLQAILAADFGPNIEIDWKNSFMVGDQAYAKGETRPDGKPGTHFSRSDRGFADNLGIRFVEAYTYFGREEPTSQAKIPEIISGPSAASSTALPSP